EPCLVAIDERPERLGIARQVLEHQPAVIQVVQRLTLESARRYDRLAHLLQGCAHERLRVTFAPFYRYGTNRTRRTGGVNYQWLHIFAAAHPSSRVDTPPSPGDRALLHSQDERRHIKDSHNALCVTDFARLDPR